MNPPPQGLRALTLAALILGGLAGTRPLSAQIPEADATFYRGLKYYYEDRLEDAAHEFGLRSALPPQTGVAEYWRALCLCRLGRTDEALDLLTEAAALGQDRYYEVSRREEFAPLREDPRYEEVLQAFGQVAQDLREQRIQTARLRKEALQQRQHVLESSPIRWQDGHGAYPQQIDFSPDGDRLVSLGEDQAAWLWSVRLREPIRMLGLFDPLDAYVAFYADGDRILICENNLGRMAILDGLTGDSLFEIELSGATLQDAIPEEDYFATLDDRGVVRLHDPDSGQVLRQFALELPAHSLWVTADRRKLFSHDLDGKARQRDPDTGVVVRELAPSRVERLTLLTDGRLLIIGPDGTRRLLDEEGAELAALPCYPGLGTTLLQTDRQRLVTWNGLWQLELWDLESGARIRQMELPDEPRNLVLCDRYLAVSHGIYGARVRVWDLETGDQVGELLVDATINGLAFSPDRRLAIAARQGIYLLGPEDSEGWALMSHAVGQGGTDVDPSGRVAVGLEGGLPVQSPPGPWSPSIPPRVHQKLARVFDLWSGEMLAELDTDGLLVERTRFLPDGRLLLSSPGVFDQELRRGPGFEAANAYEIDVSPDGSRVVQRTMPDNQGQVFDGAGAWMGFISIMSENWRSGRRYAPVAFWDQQMLVAAVNDNIEVLAWWPADTNQVPVLEGHTSTILDLEVQQELGLLVSASDDGTARVWDLHNHEPLHVLPHGDPVMQATFSADGFLVATCDYEGRARLWDPQTGEQLHELRAPGLDRAHTQVINRIAFRPDSLQLATASFDGTARLWDTSTGAEVAVMSAHLGPLWELAYTLEGSRIVTTAMDATSRIWDAQGQLLATHVEYAEGGWLTFTPEGYYVAGGQATEWAQVVVNGASYPLSSYASVLDDAERVRARLAGEAAPPAPRLLDAPELELFGPQSEVVHERRVRVRGFARDRRGLSVFRVTVNDHPLDPEVVEAAVTRSPDGKRADLDLPVDIPHRDQDAVIRVRVRNQEDLWSAPQSQVRRYEATTRSLYLLAIGVGDYEDDRLDLAGPEKDVRDLVARWRAEEGGLFQQVEVLTLVGPEVTMPRLHRAMEEFLYPAGPEDTLVVFVAGHGVLTGSDRYFFLTQDATPEEPWTGIPRHDLYELIAWDRLQPRRRVLLLDTCHAGEEFGGTTRGFQSLQDAFGQAEVDAAVAGSGLYIVSGSTESGAAREIRGNGVFTRALLEGLDGAADTSPPGSEGHGTVDVQELIDYARRAVSDVAGQQRVTTPRVQGGEPFPLGRVR